MHNADIYPEPEVYGAFQSSRPKEYEVRNNSQTAEPAGNADSPQLKNVDLISTSDVFLTLSHDRHACPCGFLVATELTMILAYIVLNCNVEQC